jgi:hypothetical protein
MCSEALQARALSWYWTARMWGLRAGVSSCALALAILSPGAAAARPLALLEVTNDALVGDLGGTVLGRSYGDAFSAVRGLRMDNIDIGLALTRMHHLVGRVELAVTDDRFDRGYLLGAVELAYRWQPVLSRELQPFLSAGAGWVGGGILCAPGSGSGAVGACWEHDVDPQLHLQAGLDVELAAGWSGELRLPFRYLLDMDRAMTAFTLGLRHSM